MDTNDEIENILNEAPLIDKSKRRKIKTPSKKPGPPKKKKIVLLGIILLVFATILIGGFILIEKLNSCESSPPETTNNINLLNSIKQQIIDKGYAEIEGLKIAPYTE